MAQHTQVILVDDLDGGTADETITFGLDGVNYEIDLSDANAARLREALGEWTSKARRQGGPRRTNSARQASTRRADLNDIRIWARGQGYTVSDRGRVAREVQEAYDRAHA